MLVKPPDIMSLEEGTALYGGEELSGKYWIFDTVSGRHFRLNEVAYYALSLLDGRRTVEEILDVCFAKYAVSRESVEKDVLGFFEDCLEKGVLTSKHTSESAANDDQPTKLP